MSADTAPAAMPVVSHETAPGERQEALCSTDATRAPAAMPGEIERLERALRHAATTASNDDYTKAGTVERARHVDRVTAMLEAADALRAFAPILAENERRDAAIAKQAEFDAWLEELAENPPPVSDALRKLYADYKASGIAAAIRAQGE